MRVIVVDQNADERLQEVAGGRDVLRRVLRAAAPACRGRATSRSRSSRPTSSRSPTTTASIRRAFWAASASFCPRIRARRPHGPRRGCERGVLGFVEEDAAMLTNANLWNRAISFAIFLRRDSSSAWAPSTSGSGSGRRSRGAPARRSTTSSARCEQARGSSTTHRSWSARRPGGRRAIGARDGASVGYLLRKHGYGPRVVARMLVRPPEARSSHSVGADGDGRGTSSQPSAVASAATAARGARRARHDARAKARARSARPPGAARRRRRRAVGEHRDTASASASATAARHARTRRDAERRSPRRRRRARARRRCADRRREARRHRLDHEARARVVHLRVQEEVCAAKQPGAAAWV